MGDLDAVVDAVQLESERICGAEQQHLDRFG